MIKINLELPHGDVNNVRACGNHYHQYKAFSSPLPSGQLVQSVRSDLGDRAKYTLQKCHVDPVKPKFVFLPGNIAVKPSKEQKEILIQTVSGHIAPAKNHLNTPKNPFVWDNIVLTLGRILLALNRILLAPDKILHTPVRNLLTLGKIQLTLVRILLTLGKILLTLILILLTLIRILLAPGKIQLALIRILLALVRILFTINKILLTLVRIQLTINKILFTWKKCAVQKVTMVLAVWNNGFLPCLYNFKCINNVLHFKYIKS